MKLVAAARLKKAQDVVSLARPYASALKEVMQATAAGAGSLSHPLLRPVPSAPAKIGVLLVSGDRGLCGSYNSNSIRKVNEIIHSYSPDQVRFVCAGKRGAAFFRRRGYSIDAEFPIPAVGAPLSDSLKIVNAARELFESGGVDVVYLVFTRFVTAMTQHTDALQLFPIEPAKDEENIEVHSQAEFEPSSEEVLAVLLPRYAETIVYQAVVESNASFFGSQMTSMSSATDNADKMISSLTLSLNRARQASITTELNEIVGGANAT
jgi:F-type H+-transporting ATPase subunit gamma